MNSLANQAMMTSNDATRNVVVKALHSGRVFGMGRVVIDDYRDRSFSMAAVAPKASPTQSAMWEVGPVLDQGTTPHCVAYAWGQFLQTAPILTTLKKLGGSSFLNRVYETSRKLEGITSGGGSSVRGGAKAVQEDGRLSTYVWGYDVDTLRRFVLSVGPVVMGTDWYEGMFTPVSSVLHPTGAVVGGHAWLVTGYDVNRDAFRMVNSWGAGWGDNGEAWVQSGDMHTLLQNGEACSAVECVPSEPGKLDTPARKKATKTVAKRAKR